MSAIDDALASVAVGEDGQLTLTCYQCGLPAAWLAPDSRCCKCTRCTVQEVAGV